VYGQTAHNRTVYASPPVGGSGSVRLGHSATLHSHGSLHPHFVRPANATHLLIRAAKTSHTAGTLCAMPPKSFKMYKKVEPVLKLARVLEQAHLSVIFYLQNFQAKCHTMFRLFMMLLQPE
jgi:hypothetical protein